MTMRDSGLNKLIEEFAEVIQVAAKKQAYLNTDIHPDGRGSLQTRLEEELADALACIALVSENLGLDLNKMMHRSSAKLELYKMWQASGDGM
jgi:NTP pyrophosphatase (non-canonical NTP hydrolase)